MTRAIVLDFDGSVAPLEEAETIGLRGREEEIRFACRRRALHSLPAPGDARLAFLGSGDFHHVTYALLARLRRPVQVLDGNYDVMGGICPWFDSLKSRQSA